MMYEFSLDKSSRKFPCPSCGKKRFVRCSDDDGRGSNYGPEHVGRCDREIECGYEYTWKQHLEDERSNNPESIVKSKPRVRPVRVRSFDFLPKAALLESLGNYEHNALVNFLARMFPDRTEEGLKSYCVGTVQTPYGWATLLPYLDAEKRFGYGKTIRYATDGHRLKDEHATGSLRFLIGMNGEFNRKPMFFGEHLLMKSPELPIAVVESEKTAVIASMTDALPKAVWIASGSLTWLKPEHLSRVGRGRRIILFPDARCFSHWEEKAVQARSIGLNVTTSRLLEDLTTAEEKESGFDLADLLLRDQEDRLIDAEEREAIRAEGCREL